MSPLPSHDPTTAGAAPRQLGEFAVVGVLGEGGSGIVYDARWGHREVALKVLHPLLVATPKERDQFLLEAQRLAQIHHAGVVKVLAVGETPDGRPYLAMEKLRGEPLAARLARGPLPVALALELFGQLADAVEALHARALVHRDLKPENVVLVAGADGREHAVLLDFGIAKDLASPASTTTQDGGVRGTPAYMAPERFFGQPASVATDVYELAVTLFAMLAGRLPWDDCADPEVRLDPRRLAEVAPHVPAGIDVEVRRALSTRAQNRPASAAELRDAVMGASGIAWAPRRTVEVGSGPLRLPPSPEGGAALAATVPVRGGAPTPGAAGGRGADPSVVPAPTVRRPVSRRAWIALGVAAAAAVAVGLVAHRMSRPGAPLDARSAAADDEAARERLAAAAPDTTRVVEGAAPPAPRGDAGRELTAALRVLPDDALFAIGVQVAALGADRDLRDVIELFADSPPGRLLRAQARFGGCALDVRGRTDWIVVAGSGEDDAIDVIASGRWTREEAEACLREAGGADPAVGWLDDRTLYVTTRRGADAAWFAERLADATPPGGVLGAILPDVDTTGVIWVAGDDAAARRAQLADQDVQGIWGSLRANPSRVAMTITFRYPDAAKADAAERELKADLGGMSLDGIGKLDIARVHDHPERLRIEVDLPRFVVGILMQGVRTGDLGW